MVKKSKRTDLVVVCDSPGRRFTKVAMRDLIRYLVGAGIGLVSDVAEGEDWVEVYLSPAFFSHLVLVKSTPETEDEPFLEVVIRLGSVPVALKYPDVEGQHCFFFEIRGSYLETIGADFRVRLEQLMGVRSVVHNRVHKKLAPHRESDPEVEAKGASGVDSAGPVGVLVEDL